MFDQILISKLLDLAKECINRMPIELQERVTLAFCEALAEMETEETIRFLKNWLKFDGITVAEEMAA